MSMRQTMVEGKCDSRHRSNNSRTAMARATQIRTGAKIVVKNANSTDEAFPSAPKHRCLTVAGFKTAFLWHHWSNGLRIATPKATQIRTGARIPARSANIICPTRLIMRHLPSLILYSSTPNTIAPGSYFIWIYSSLLALRQQWKSSYFGGKNAPSSGKSDGNSKVKREQATFALGAGP